jgi:hypothetical protein
MNLDVVVRIGRVGVLCVLVAGCEQTSAVAQVSQSPPSITLAKPLPKLGVVVSDREFVLNESTLSEIQMILLGGSVVEDRTTAEPQSTLCYLFASGDTRQRVRFLSDAEFGGRDRALTGIEASLEPPGQQPPTNCLVITSVNPPAGLPGGIWLTSSSAEIAGILGVSNPSDGHQSFREQSKFPSSTQREELDATRMIDFYLAHGEIVRLSMREIVSN